MSASSAMKMMQWALSHGIPEIVDQGIAFAGIYAGVIT
jgi:hypothetical protein